MRNGGSTSAMPMLRPPVGFTLVELMMVILLLAILTALAVPVFLDTRVLAQRNTCRYNQRTMESSLNMWKFSHDTDQFMTGNCLPGDGEAFIDIKGNIPGEPDRTLAPYQKRGFDCPGNGLGKGETGGCDYITDGIAVTCLTDNQIGLKADGTPFLHDKPQSVNWNHSGDREVEKKKTPLGNTFTDITKGMIGLIQAYYDKYGKYPRSFGDYVFTDIGLKADDWKMAVDHIYYGPAGNRMKVTPEEGYVFKVLDTRGNERVLRPRDKWSLWYDMETKAWYFKNINPGQAIDISTLKVVKE